MSKQQGSQRQFMKDVNHYVFAHIFGRTIADATLPDRYCFGSTD
jgi:hypothetical protein